MTSHLLACECQGAWQVRWMLLVVAYLYHDSLFVPSLQIDT